MSDQVKFYENKLSYEIDSSDLDKAPKAGEKIVVVDARSREAYELEHIPGAIRSYDLKVCKRKKAAYPST